MSTIYSSANLTRRIANATHSRVRGVKQGLRVCALKDEKVARSPSHTPIKHASSNPEFEFVHATSCADATAEAALEAMSNEPVSGYLIKQCEPEAAEAVVQKLRANMASYFSVLASSDLSVSVVHKPSEKVAGVLLCRDFVAKPPTPDFGYPVQYMIDAVHESQSKFRDAHEHAAEGDVLELFVLGVLPEFGGKGLARGLVDAAVQVARDRGFKACLADTSGAFSGKAFAKNGFMRYNEVVYDNWAADGSYPIRGAPAPHVSMVNQVLYLNDAFRPSPDVC